MHEEFYSARENYFYTLIEEAIRNHEKLEFNCSLLKDDILYFFRDGLVVGEFKVVKNKNEANVIIREPSYDIFGKWFNYDKKLRHQNNKHPSSR